jgi:membrane protease YdiL (CAAX protease family)
MITGPLTLLHPVHKLLVLTGLSLIFTALFSQTAILLAQWIYQVTITDSTVFLQLDNVQTVKALKLVQALGAGLGTFIVTSLIAAFLFGGNLINYLQMYRTWPRMVLPAALLLMITCVPVVNLMLEWNSRLQLPEYLSTVEEWMRHSEQKAERITQAFIQVSAFSDLMINLLVIAFLPAVGEELFFRGLVQRLLSEWFRNAHFAIWLTAALFSAIHLQFFGFLPRMMLGALFGYMLLWTQSIWLPVIAHFFNNAAFVIAGWYVFNNKTTFNPDRLGVEEGHGLWLVFSAIFSLLLIIQLYACRRK